MSARLPFDIFTDDLFAAARLQLGPSDAAEVHRTANRLHQIYQCAYDTRRLPALDFDWIGECAIVLFVLAERLAKKEGLA